MSEKMSEGLTSMPGIGLPANAPERPAEPLAYPAVHDMPPPRTTAVLNPSDQKKMETELVSAREQQKLAIAPPEPLPPPPAPAAPAARKKPPPRPAASAAAPTTVQPSSSRTIY